MGLVVGMATMDQLLAIAWIAPIAGASATATAAFFASNLDDIVVLLLLFSGAEGPRGRWPVVAGQYLGFGLLVLASLVGLVGGHLVASPWTGLLGLIPVGLGVSQILDSLKDRADGWLQRPSAGADPLLPATLSPGHGSGLAAGALGARVSAVAALTLANGGDNVGLYMPLFAHADRLQLITTLVVFALLVGVWCLAAWHLVQTPTVALLIQRHGRRAVPWLLIGIGGLLLLQNEVFSDRSPAVLALAALLVMAGSVLRELRRLELAAGTPQPHHRLVPMPPHARDCLFHRLRGGVGALAFAALRLD